jgi:hypothetical protein
MLPAPVTSRKRSRYSISIHEGLSKRPSRSAIAKSCPPNGRLPAVPIFLLAWRTLHPRPAAGVPARLVVSSGPAPGPPAPSALWIREHLPGSIIPDALVDRLQRAGDPETEGKRICIDLLHELTQISGVSGAHIMAPRNQSAIAEVIAEAHSESGTWRKNVTG